VDRIVEKLRAIVGRKAVLAEPGELLVYECDGLPQHKHRPRAVVFPSSTEETSAVMRVLADEGVPFTPRGAGTGLSGGALALDSGVVIEMARMRKILRIDPLNRFAVVQPGVVNAHVSRAAAPFSLHYVPDPSSQSACTIGGNIAENAGGIHCLKYGTTTDHVLGVTVVLSNGDIVKLGGFGTEAPGLDLLGPFIGSEGTFGIVTEAMLRLVPVPPAIRTLLAEFLELDDASRAVSAIIAAGVIPAALEMMDHNIIVAVEASSFAAGLPTDVAAALLIELDGIEAGIDDETDKLREICTREGARTCRLARDEKERKKLWAARKGAFGAISRIAPDSMIQDAVVPRSRLPEVLAAAARIAATYQLHIANVFHAGDGNLHPLICFDSRSADEVRRVKEAGRELMEICVRVGGSITGEHGVGLDKRELLPLIFSDDDMNAMLRVRAAFDPLGILNPGKIIPVLRGCGEGRAIATLSDNGNGTPQSTGTRVDRSPERNGNGRPSSFVSDRFPERDSAVRIGNTEAVYQKINSIVGQQFVSASTAFSAASSSSLTHSPSLPAPDSVFVTPGSVAEVCQLIQVAATEHWQINPAGAGTSPGPTNAERITIKLCTGRLNRILEHEPADLVATAQAGVSLSAFNAELNKRGQWLPLDPPDDGSATLGGVVATGLAGAQKCGYGSPRTYVIGMRVALANGKVTKVGGRVVKNVAGYDLCKLFTGSRGSLGVILEMTFKVRPRPQSETTVIASGSVSSLLQSARSILEQRLFPVALELISPGVARELDIEIGGTECLLLVRFAGNETGIAFQSQQAALALRTKTVATEVVAEDQFIWKKLARLPLKWGSQQALRADVLAENLAPLIESLESRDSLLWHAGVADGRLQVIDTGSSEAGETSFRAFDAASKALGVSLTLENANADTYHASQIAQHAPEHERLLQRIKLELDPDDLFPLKGSLTIPRN
jgi:glycolate oxidase subunit GlcD